MDRPESRSAWRWAVRGFWKCGDDRVLGLAAEIAFFAVLSVFPGLLMLAAGLGSLGALVGEDVATRVEEEVVTFLQLVLTEKAEGTVDAVEDLFSDAQGRVLTVAFVLALVTVSGAFAAAISSLNTAYRVRETRNWFVRRAIGLVMAMGTLALASVVLAIVVAGPLFGREDRIDVIAPLYSQAWGLFRWPVLFLALVSWATTLCHFAPSRRTRWRHDLAGGVLTAVLWLAATLAFSAYLRLVSDSNPVFSALGGGVVLMAWVYLLSLSLVLGGELNGVLEERRLSRLGPDAELVAERAPEVPRTPGAERREGARSSA